MRIEKIMEKEKTPDSIFVTPQEDFLFFKKGKAVEFKKNWPSSEEYGFATTLGNGVVVNIWINPTEIVKTNDWFRIKEDVHDEIEFYNPSEYNLDRLLIKSGGKKYRLTEVK